MGAMQGARGRAARPCSNLSDCGALRAGMDCGRPTGAIKAGSEPSKDGCAGPRAEQRRFLFATGFWRFRPAFAK